MKLNRNFTSKTNYNSQSKFSMEDNKLRVSETNLMKPRPQNPDSRINGSRRGAAKTLLDKIEIVTDLVPHLSDISNEICVKIHEVTDNDIDISNDNPSRYDDLGIKTQMNFNGPGGQQNCKDYIKQNSKRPFFGNQEYKKRKNDIDVLLRKSTAVFEPTIK